MRLLISYKPPASIWWLFLHFTYYFSSTLIKVCRTELINPRWWMSTRRPWWFLPDDDVRRETLLFLIIFNIMSRVLSRSRKEVLWWTVTSSPLITSHTREGERGGSERGRWVTEILPPGEMWPPISSMKNDPGRKSRQSQQEEAWTGEEQTEWESERIWPNAPCRKQTFTMRSSFRQKQWSGFKVSPSD